MGPWIVLLLLAAGGVAFYNILILWYSIAAKDDYDYWFLGYVWLEEYSPFNLLGRILAIIILSIMFFPYFLLRGIGWLLTFKKSDMKKRR